MKELVFLLEEQSAQAMLEGLLPRILPADITTRMIVFEGRQDLERQLERRLRGYRNQQARFIVLRDQDAHPDCQEVKASLARRCVAAGRPDATVRIACRELESFYLADLAAVELGLGLTNLARRQDRRRYRAPDQLGSPSAELKRLTGGRYQKVGGSREIGPHLDLENTRSASFRNLVAAIRRTAGELAEAAAE